jgi:hypothetical protein
VLPLIIGIGLLALAAGAVIGALVAAKSDADKNFCDDAAGTPSHGCGASNPCSGLGSATDANVKAYNESFKAAQKEWPKLTPDQRRDKMKELGNSQLGKSGVPSVGVKTENTGGPGNAHFSFPNWELVVDDATLKSPTLSDADAKEFADTVFHEGRHAEQWYLMAQKRAGEGASADEIRDELGIPGNVAQAAVANPLKPDDPRKACADKVYESVYGKDAAARNKTLGDLKTKGAAVDAAASKLDAVNKNPASTAADKAKAAQDYKDAYDDYLKVDKAYHALPEEADAWEAGGKVQKAW